MGGYQNHQVVAYDNLDELNRKFYSVAFACGKDAVSYTHLDVYKRQASASGVSSIYGSSAANSCSIPGLASCVT